MDASTKEISKLLQQAIDAADTNDTESARKLYARCLALDGESRASASSAPGVRCRAWLNAVDFRLEQGEPRDALGLARRAARLWPRAALVHTMLGECYAALEQFVEAERAYRRSNALRPLPETLARVAHVLRYQGRDEESVQCFHQVLALDPNYEEAHYNIGLALVAEERYAEAIERFERALELDPDYAIAHRELGRAILKATKGSERRALLHLQHSVALDPSDHWSQLYLAVCLWRLERIRKARVHYEAAVRLAPDDGLVLSCHADFLSAEFGPSDALEARFQKAIGLDAESASVRFFYGKHLLRAKRYTEARVQLLLADRLGHPRALEVLRAAE
jgi:tetratricopeptide (TPR) repeat protein